MNHRRLTMIHCHMDQPALERPAPEGDTEGNVIKREGAYFRFDDYRTANSRSAHGGGGQTDLLNGLPGADLRGAGYRKRGVGPGHPQ